MVPLQASVYDMTGFFSTTELRDENAYRKVGKRSSQCGSCGLYKTCDSPKMKVSGDGTLGILIVAEAPGREEDEQGTQLVGKAGKELRRDLDRLDVDLHTDCWKINALNCRPPKNRTPKPHEIEACRPRVFKAINELKPDMILAMGGPAMRSLLGHRWKGASGLGGITRWRGWTIPDRQLGTWLCPVFHPNYVMSSSKEQRAIRKIYLEDLERALNCLDRKFPKYKDETQYVETSEDVDEIVHYLKDLNRRAPPLIAFDYEGTGLKPQAKGQHLVSCAISENRKHAFAFPIEDNERVKVALAKVLTNKRIGKIAANIKFEELWTRSYLGVEVANWKWDPMLAAHVEDNRKWITGVKFQTYVQFGVVDYDSHIAPFLKSLPGAGANGLNRIHKIKMSELLVYNGLDALYEFWNAKRQMKRMR